MHFETYICRLDLYLDLKPPYLNKYVSWKYGFKLFLLILLAAVCLSN